MTLSLGALLVSGLYDPAHPPQPHGHRAPAHTARAGTPAGSQMSPDRGTRPPSPHLVWAVQPSHHPAGWGSKREEREQQVQVSGCTFQIHTHTLSRTHRRLRDCLLAVDKEQREGEKMQKSSEGFLGRGRVYKSPHKVLLYSKTSESTGMSQPLWHLEYWS